MEIPKKNEKYEDDDGDIFTVISVRGKPDYQDFRIILIDEEGIKTTFPDDFDDDNFDVWFTKI